MAVFGAFLVTTSFTGLRSTQHWHSFQAATGVVRVGLQGESRDGRRLGTLIAWIVTATTFSVSVNSNGLLGRSPPLHRIYPAGS
jgi:ABC-type transporter Mla maintaining outer membrane lipid asymmetry permease subunit MlaE